MAKRALLIGINHYALANADLRGCVNDVQNMAAALVDTYGFTDSDITMLVDDQATKAAMQAGITGLVSGARSGDVLYLHYSGHGSNVPDTSGDEADGRDEILCPHDLDWDDPLTDDWLRTTFDGLAAGASLTVVMDCCHSGTNTREPMAPDAPILPRFLANPIDLERGGEHTGTSKRAARRDLGDVGDVQVVGITETLLAGCRDNQTSADADIDGTYNGALTYYLAETLRSLGPTATYRDVHAATLARLKGNYDQVPQLEGQAPRLDRAYLSPQD